MEKDTNGVKRLERWSSSDGSDLRDTDDTMLRIDTLVKEWGAKSVVMPSAIIGCPHEEGIDYPEGESCPECPFWENRDRWSGDLAQWGFLIRHWSRPPNRQIFGTEKECRKYYSAPAPRRYRLRRCAENLID